MLLIQQSDYDSEKYMRKGATQGKEGPSRGNEFI